MGKRRIKATIAAIIKGMYAFIAAIAEDVLILGGLGIIVYSTFRLSDIAGWYSLGACLLGLGIYAAARQNRGDK